MKLPHPGVVVDRLIAGGFGFLLLTLCSCQTPGIEQGYPSRSLELIVPWEDGSGARVGSTLSNALTNELGKPVDVVHRPSDNGIASHVALAQSLYDGYTLGILTVEATMLHWTGITTVDLSHYSPIALIAIDPAVITVRGDADWQGIHELIKTLESNPGTLIASGTYFGGIWDLERIGFLSALNLTQSTLPWDPSPDTKTALQKLLAGDIDVAITSVSDVDSLRKTGHVRSLAVMANERLPSAPEIPTLMELGINYASAGSWMALAAPNNLPDARLELLRVAIWNISRQSDFRQSLADDGMHFRYITGSALESFLREEDFRNGTLLDQAGLALE
ncbi:MAG: tripartite tricarboxylate transporter substrate binding protein [Bacteroidetes bacterium]|nr:tripartite tricarboxylate transporter substrate binding protein [Bacteroidota bacterium]MCY4204568.1 tripartite tricarboxylate transporter substrate binding protein [Bacteroidota bacterium]